LDKLCNAHKRKIFKSKFGLSHKDSKCHLRVIIVKNIGNLKNKLYFY
jgi:hypothetical protein